MLYTGSGDDGKMTTFGCDQRVSKSSAIAEALGSLDEINSFLGFCKVRSRDAAFMVKDTLSFEQVAHDMQQKLFIIQATVAGYPKPLGENAVEGLGEVIDYIETHMDPIKTFFISGGTELAATFDFARTLARRAERRVVAVSEEQAEKIPAEVLQYMNRLSSMLYALARYANHLAGIKEEPPKYS
ncbi:MAG TPA: cob(I)yrinic acid a,c-diamide adenosyltransferase [Candidatus Paceibacterota bacterium]|nr:cob(I)yrinic acid a,c-diamide adenosyltransferase [Candidatus Paceibacterota bacterium]